MKWLTPIPAEYANHVARQNRDLATRQAVIRVSSTNEKIYTCRTTAYERGNIEGARLADERIQRRFERYRMSRYRSAARKREFRQYHIVHDSTHRLSCSYNSLMSLYKFKQLFSAQMSNIRYHHIWPSQWCSWNWRVLLLISTFTESKLQRNTQLRIQNIGWSFRLAAHQSASSKFLRLNNSCFYSRWGIVFNFTHTGNHTAQHRKRRSDVWICLSGPSNKSRWLGNMLRQKQWPQKCYERIMTDAQDYVTFVLFLNLELTKQSIAQRKYRD